MAQPLPYERDYDFEGFQSGHPQTPLPGDKVNDEFDLVQGVVDELLVRIALLQDDDLALKRGSVGYDQLNAEVDIGFIPPTLWTTTTAYVVRSTVFANSNFYRCLVSHTSGTFSTDLAAGKWELVADFTGATTAAEAAQAAAEVARAASEAAQTGAEAAQSATVTLAANAATSAGSAATSSSSASGFADAALASSAVAETARDVALAAQTAADAAQDGAEAAQTASETARDQAVAAANGVSAPKETLAEVVSDAPLIDPEHYVVAYYDTNYVRGSGANYRKVAIEPSHAGKIQNGNGTWYEIQETVLRPQMLGASTAAADNASVLQSAMTLAASQNVPLYLGEKGTTWPCTGTIIPTVAGKRLELRGHFKILFSGTGYLNISGTVTDTTYVATAVAKGSRTLVVNDASGLAVGDVIIIEDDTDWSFSASQHTGREAYHAGDFARIAGISTNTLTLERPLRYGYGAATTSKVYKAAPVALVTDAFEVEASDTPTASAIASVVVGGALNFSVKGGNQYAAFFNKLWETDGRAGRYIHTAPNTGNNYGLVVGNAQDCNFYDVYAYGTRRGIATGTGGGDAGVCMHNVKFIGGASDNGDDTIGSADFHGDADDCAYIKHRATFFDVGGRSCQIIDCEVAPRGALDPVSWTELAGGAMVVKNLKVTRPAGATFTGIVSGRNGSQLAAIAEDYSFTVDGVTITNGATLVSVVGFLNAAVSPTRSSVFVDDVKILGGAPASNFRVLSSSVSNVASHGAGVAAPVSLEVGDKCVWPFATTHFWITTSGTHTGCRIWAPSTTFLTSFTCLAAASTSTAQAFSFVGYPFAPKVDCSVFGLTSAAGQLFYGHVDAAAASSATVNMVTGKSANTAGADRTLSARVEVSMRGAIAA